MKFARLSTPLFFSLALAAWLIVSGCNQPDREGSSSNASDVGEDVTSSDDQSTSQDQAASVTDPNASDNSTDNKPVTDEAADESSDPLLTSKESPNGESNSDESADDTIHKDAKDEHLLKGWPEPAVALLLTGEQHGYIEPCGCTGLEHQKGGLLRRHTLVKQLRDRGWNVVPVDVGNQVRRFGVQPTIKFASAVQGLAKVMNYRAIGFGPDDLRLPGIELYQAIENNLGDENPFSSANVDILGGFPEKFRVLTVGDKKIGLTSILGDEHHSNINNPDVTIRSTEEGLNEVWPLLEKEQCDYYVLLASADMEATTELAKKYPYFNLIVTAGDLDMPKLDPDTVEVNGHITQIVQVGIKGMYAGVLGFFADDETPVRYQRVPLDSRFEDSPEMMKVFTDYQKLLEISGLDGLDLRPIAHPTGYEFVGSELCGDCHSHAYEIWKDGTDGNGGPHARATESLTHPPNNRAWIPRHFDPECLSCHVTGWNAQKYFVYQGGYLDVEKSIDLHGNGCENCHGPGSQHVAAEDGTIDADDDMLKEFRAEMRITKEDSHQEVCMKCHDLDNSPDFHVDGAFEEYWKKIEHYGVD